METTYVYLISLYDTQEPSGMFFTEAEAYAAAERYLTERWKAMEEEIKTSNVDKKTKEEEMFFLLQEKKFWEDYKLIEDVIYIYQVPMNKLVSYNGNEY